MTLESSDVKIARMDEQLKAVREDMVLARDSRKQQYEMIEQVNRTLVQMESRFANVEQKLAANAPTIQEFMDIKLKVQGAGIAGKWAWAIVVSVITFLFSIREAVLTWMAK